jgi:hypothetical protein
VISGLFRAAEFYEVGNSGPGDATMVDITDAQTLLNRTVISASFTEIVSFIW